MKIIDDFLPPEQLKTLQDTIIFGGTFPFYLSSHLNNNDTESDFWEWYGYHLIYNTPHEHIYHHVIVNQMGKGRVGVNERSYYNLVWNEIFSKKINPDKLLRIKANFYPHTQTVKEHSSHVDYDFSHAGAVYSLNTCDGYTRIGEEVVESIENRMVFFDASELHNSTTTSNAKGRININFNFL